MSSSENEFKSSFLNSTPCKKIALVDCDSFFASCEQLVNPSLVGKPVCVMSNNDGCIVARSKEAKELGVKMAMPVFQARQLFPEVEYVSGNLSLYGSISSRVMSVLREFTPDIEIYSIDEAFLDLTGFERLYKKSYFEIIADIREAVFKKVGVPVSIGVSTSKVLAKLASNKAKKGSGICEIKPEEIPEMLKNTMLNDVWGIGKRTVILLNSFGLQTAYGFISKNDDFVKRYLGKRGLDLKLELSGFCVSPVDSSPSPPKSIQKTSSFPIFTSDEKYIINFLNYHTHRACKKLRGHNLKAKTINVMLRTKDFRVYSIKKELVHPSNWEIEIFGVVKELFYKIYMPDTLYRSSGVVFDDLNEFSPSQLSLLKPIEEDLKHKNLAKAWDKLELKYGNGIISLESLSNISETSECDLKMQNTNIDFHRDKIEK